MAIVQTLDSDRLGEENIYLHAHFTRMQELCELLIDEEVKRARSTARVFVAQFVLVVVFILQLFYFLFCSVHGLLFSNELNNRRDRLAKM